VQHRSGWATLKYLWWGVRSLTTCYGPMMTLRSSCRRNMRLMFGAEGDLEQLASSYAQRLLPHSIPVPSGAGPWAGSNRAWLGPPPALPACGRRLPCRGGWGPCGPAQTMGRAQGMGGPGIGGPTLGIGGRAYGMGGRARTWHGWGSPAHRCSERSSPEEEQPVQAAKRTKRPTDLKNGNWGTFSLELPWLLLSKVVMSRHQHWILTFPGAH
jgi:hypothetical protein